MYAMSPAMQATLRLSHTPVFKLELFSNGQPVPVPGSTSSAWPMEPGASVTVDANAAIERRFSVIIPDPTGTLAPVNSTDLLAPFGNEFRPWRGVVLPDGTPEMVPLGYFGIADVDVQRGPKGQTIKIDAYDRSHKIQEARWLKAYNIAAGTNYVTAIQNMVAFRNPWVQFRFPSLSSLTPDLVFGEARDNDPLKDAQTMAAAIGYRLHFDLDGFLTMKPVTPVDPTTPVDWNYYEGDGGMVTDVSRKLTAEKVYNHVIVTGESTSNTAPVFGEAYDNNPSSPTYINGPFGDRPYFLSSQFMTSNDQCVSAAAAILTRVMTPNQSISWGSLVNPAHEVGDVLRSMIPSASVNARFLLDSFSIPLDYAGTMTPTARRWDV